MTWIARRLAATGVAAAQGFRDRGQITHQRILQIAKATRRQTDAARQDVRDLTAAIADWAAATRRTAQQVLDAMQVEGEPAAGATHRQATAILDTVRTHTRQVVDGAKSLPARVVSVLDPMARPIVQGKGGKPVKFGYKVGVDEPDDGFIMGWATAVGNRPDIRFLPSALAVCFGALREAAMDRGYWDADTVAALEAAKIFVAIPK